MRLGKFTEKIGFHQGQYIHWFHQSPFPKKNTGIIYVTTASSLVDQFSSILSVRRNLNRQLARQTVDGELTPYTLSIQTSQLVKRILINSKQFSKSVHLSSIWTCMYFSTWTNRGLTCVFLDLHTLVNAVSSERCHYSIQPILNFFFISHHINA